MRGCRLTSSHLYDVFLIAAVSRRRGRRNGNQAHFVPLLDKGRHACQPLSQIRKTVFPPVGRRYQWTRFRAFRYAPSRVAASISRSVCRFLSNRVESGSFFERRPPQSGCPKYHPGPQKNQPDQSCLAEVLPERTKKRPGDISLLIFGNL